MTTVSVGAEDSNSSHTRGARLFSRFVYLDSVIFCGQLKILFLELRFSRSFLFTHLTVLLSDINENSNDITPTLSVNQGLRKVLSHSPLIGLDLSEEHLQSTETITVIEKSLRY